MIGLRNLRLGSHLALFMAASVVIAPAAFAAKLFTPPLQPLDISNGHIRCLITNTSERKPVSADVTVFTGSIATAPAQVCIAAGVSVISVPITAGASGETLLSVVAGAETFELRVRVNLGAENLGAGIAPVVGVLNATSSNPVLAPVVGVLNATTSNPVLAPIVGAELQ